MQSEDIQALKFFQTAEHACSYLPERQARTVFLDPQQAATTQLYSRLITAGFRRGGEHLYRPGCDHCDACIACRVRVRDFKHNKRFARLWRRNADIQSAQISTPDTSELFELYCRYINGRHADGDMSPPDLQQYRGFIAARTPSTQFHVFTLEDRPIALSVLDVLDHGLSAMYTFFDPDLAQRSLGTWVILWQIEKARRLHLPSLYLGYWIRDCDKMRYKTDFRPLELLIGKQWLLLT
jgi:arginyl-tRNA--protein-N-Asp/Glu arginylyltransferase